MKYRQLLPYHMGIPAKVISAGFVYVALRGNTVMIFFYDFQFFFAYINRLLPPVLHPSLPISDTEEGLTLSIRFCRSCPTFHPCQMNSGVLICDQS